MNHIRQGDQRLQASAFCVITVNDEHTKPRFKWDLYLKMLYALKCV